MKLCDGKAPRGTQRLYFVLNFELQPHTLITLRWTSFTRKMGWLLLVVALGLGVGLLIVTVGYKRSIVVLLAALLLGVVLIIWYAEFYEEKGSGLISVDEVSLSNFQVRKTYGESYEMSARVHNASPDFLLTAVGIEVSALDCTGEGDGQTCTIVGQQEHEIQIDVPAQQARDVIQQFILPKMRPLGSLLWEHALLYTRARK